MALQATTWEDFRAHTFPPIEYVLSPWLPTRGLCMVSGHRGIGKTFFTTALAWAIATGGCVMGYTAGEPRTICYIDGEMDPAELQERFVGLEQASRGDCNGDADLSGRNLAILSHAACGDPFGLPDLSDREGQDRFDEAIGKSEVVVADNLSCLIRSGEENTADSWAPVQEWLVSLRRDGKVVILVHHTGKPQGEFQTVSQRGTSKREDPLNASIVLTHPRNGPRAGALRMEFTKLRRVAPGVDIETIRKGKSVQVEVGDNGTRINVRQRDAEEEKVDEEA